jgi:hypothetical protein
MNEEGRIEKQDIYSFDGATAIHTPKNMSSTELTEVYWKLYEDVFSIRSIFSRTIFRRNFFKNPAKYLFFLYVNFYYRTQIKHRITPNII